MRVDCGRSNAAPLSRALLAWLFAAFLSLPLWGHAAEKTTILVLGDSLSAGYGLRDGEGWVDLLADDWRARGVNAELVNDSISGDTTAGGVARLPNALARVQPDWVLIELGGNDGLRGGSLAAMEANLIEMIEQTRASGADAALLGIALPPNYGATYTAGFAAVYQRVAEHTGAPLLPLFIRGIENDPAWFLPDQIHPNAAAQPIIMRNVRAFLEAQPFMQALLAESS